MKSSIDRLIEWCLIPFSTVYQLYRYGQCTYPCFPRVLLTSIQHNILSKPLASFPHNHRRNSGERGMHPVAMTIINPRKEYRTIRGSNQQLPVLKSPTLSAELWGSAAVIEKDCWVYISGAERVNNRSIYYLHLF